MLNKLLSRQPKLTLTLFEENLRKIGTALSFDLFKFYDCIFYGASSFRTESIAFKTVRHLLIKTLIASDTRTFGWRAPVDSTETIKKKLLLNPNMSKSYYLLLCSKVISENKQYLQMKWSLILDILTLSLRSGCLKTSLLPVSHLEDAT